MAAGDRLINPGGDGYATHEVTDETLANGFKQAALIVKQVDDSGATVTPGALPAGAATAARQDTGNASLATISSKLTGAPNSAVTQVTAGSASGALIAARAARRVFVVRNHDGANSCYIGKGVVSSATGFLLKAGESISIESVEAWTCIRDTADVSLGVIELYD